MTGTEINKICRSKRFRKRLYDRVGAYGWMEPYGKLIPPFIRNKQNDYYQDCEIDSIIRFAKNY